MSSNLNHILRSEPCDPARDPVRHYLDPLERASRATMEKALRGLVRAMFDDVEMPPDPSCVAWECLSPADMTDIGTRLRQQRRQTPNRAGEQPHLSKATIRLRLAVLRSLLETSWTLGLLPYDQYQRLIASKNLKARRTHDPPTPVAGSLIDSDILGLLTRSCQIDRKQECRRMHGLRDLAIIAVLYNGGLRRSELVALDCTDYDEREYMLQIRHGKGDKARPVYLAPETGRVLEDWLRALPADGNPALFRRLHRHGQILPRRLTDQAIYYIIQQRAAAVAIPESMHITPHDFRRTCISLLLDNTDISTVKEMVGHTSVETTARYDRRSHEVRQDAARNLVLPNLMEDQSGTEDS